MCVFDVGAFATIAAAVITCATALAIAQNWRDQKGAEVVANEVKNVIKDLLEIINISYNMNSYSASKEVIADKSERFEILSGQILRGSLFVNDTIEIDKLSSLIEDFNKLCWEVKDIHLEYHSEKNIEKFKSNLKGKVGYIGSKGMSLVNILKPYSVYQKEFKFKK